MTEKELLEFARESAHSHSHLHEEIEDIIQLYFAEISDEGTSVINERYLAYSSIEDLLK